MGGDKVISVTVCKDRLLTNYLGLVTSNLMLATEASSTSTRSLRKTR